MELHHSLELRLIQDKQITSFLAYIEVKTIIDSHYIYDSFLLQRDE